MTQKFPFKNALACIVAGVTSSIVALRIGRKFVPVIPFVWLVALAIVYLAGVIVFIFIWKKKASRSEINSESTFAFWQGITRYFLAMDMVMFALQKIFHLQFAIPMARLDDPFSSLSGEDLVWAFFGKFYTFTLIIAFFQIASAVLLLFSRTRLFAIILLLPILCNIFLLDWFYDLGLVVNLYISLLTLAAVYLLLTEYPRLKQLFFIVQNNLPAFSCQTRAAKNAVRFSAVAIPLILMACYRLPETNPEINGRYEVKRSSSNLFPKADACPGDTLTKVFFDGTDIVFDFGTYRKRLIGSYTYNSQSGQIKGIWRYPVAVHDTLSARIRHGKNKGALFLSGIMGNKKLFIEMQKSN
jgi:hypothetical protein